MFFDTHAHLQPFAADGSLPRVVRDAQAAGVGRLCAVGSDPAANAFSLSFALDHPGFAVAAVGLDRDQIGQPADPGLLAEQAAAPAVAAIGEIGLDYFYSPETAKPQRDLFASMLELALRAGKPVIVHSRDAQEDTLAMLRDYAAGAASRSPGLPPGILHCFTGSAAFAERLLELGFFISFSGILSFLNADPLRAAARTIPADRLLVETDSPYLAPRPFRGRTNEPRFVVRVAEVLAETRGEPLETIEKLTTANACRVFRLEPPTRKEPAP
jgi:TatD DNase family protein